MAVRREKKRKYLRGWRTHGWGRVGQHRRSGRKGGRGRAGMHKHKWTWVVKYAPDYFGKHGFTRPPELVPEHKCINLKQLDELVGDLLEKGALEIVEGLPLVDLPRLGYSKLLGGGRVSRPLYVKTLYATERAVEKIEEAGGRVEVLRGES